MDEYKAVMVLKHKIRIIVWYGIFGLNLFAKCFTDEWHENDAKNLYDYNIYIWLIDDLLVYFECKSFVKTGASLKCYIYLKLKLQ